MKALPPILFHCLVTACLLAGLAQVAAAESPVPKVETLLNEIKDDNAAWNVGFCALNTDPGLSAATQNLARSLPTLWRAAFSAELTHAMTTEDQGEAASALLAQAQNRVRADISQQIDNRDKAWFDRTLTPAMDTNFDKLIADDRAKLTGLLQLRSTICCCL